MESPTSNTQALPAGTRLEEFVIERVLGSGGFGITYLARDTRLDRQVVIKENLPAQFCFRDTHSLTVAPRHTHGEDADNFRWSLENFSREAAMLASLDHPGIVKVLRSFEAFGTAYFVMPYLEGLTFDELIASRRDKGQEFSEEELGGFLFHVLGALGYLHDRGIYHRDIKPGNILVTLDGMPVLIDFGSARQRLSERSMTVIESAGYTPFEQLQSRGNVGPWSDLYALAATLVKVMTGEAPPKANDRTMGDPWQPLSGRSELAGRHSEVFLGCLDRALMLRVEYRWQCADEWTDRLSGRAAAKAEPAQDCDQWDEWSVRLSGQPAESQPKAVPGLPAPQPVLRPRKPNLAPRSLAPSRVPAIPNSVVSARRSMIDVVSSDEYWKKAESLKNPHTVPAVVGICGVLLFCGIALLMTNNKSDYSAANVTEETVKVKELAQNPNSITAGDSGFVRKAEPVREKISVGQPGEEREFEIAPGVTMAFCWIPPGEFVMGSPTAEDGRRYDESQVKVTLSKGFWLGKYEVTQAQWRAAGGVDPSGRAPWSEDGQVKVSWAELGEGGVVASNFQGDTLPVERVTWGEVRDWCFALNAKIGVKDDPNGEWRYSLPTEAQWEYAARAGTSTGLNSGKELTTQEGTCRNLDELAWYLGNSGKHTHRVGQKKPNAWGLHDMHGNVFEWCGDWYGDTLSGGVDPKGPDSGSYRVYRGGGWSGDAADCHVALRNYYNPMDADLGIGFRVARSSVP